MVNLIILIKIEYIYLMNSWFTETPFNQNYILKIGFMGKSSLVRIEIMLKDEFILNLE